VILSYDEDTGLERIDYAFNVEYVAINECSVPAITKGKTRLTVGENPPRLESKEKRR
jgi:hypothetical protein